MPRWRYENASSSQSKIILVGVNPSTSFRAGANNSEESEQDKLDDIQEKLDVISQQVQALVLRERQPLVQPEQLLPLRF